MSLRTLMLLPLSFIDLEPVLSNYTRYGPRHESASARSRGKHPMVVETETNPAHVREGFHRARVYMSLFGSPIDHELYCLDFRQWKVIASRDIDFSSLKGSCLEALFFDIGWLPLVTLLDPVYPTLVQVFFARAHISGSSISSTLRGVEFDISAPELCHLLSIRNTGAQVFESKTWPQVDDFDPAAAVCRLTGSIAHRVGQLQDSSLTHDVRLLHQIVGHCILLRSGH